MKKPKPTKVAARTPIRSARRKRTLIPSAPWERTQILGDGTIITPEDYKFADLELHAFFRLNSLRYDTLKMNAGLMPIPLKIVFKRQPATTSQMLDLVAHKAANEKFNWNEVNRFLKQQGVTLVSAGLDEVPMAYKNIRDVMAAQKDLVTVLGEFMPKLVKMAPSGERPED